MYVDCVDMQILFYEMKLQAKDIIIKLHSWSLDMSLAEHVHCIDIVHYHYVGYVRLHI